MIIAFSTLPINNRYSLKTGDSALFQARMSICQGKKLHAGKTPFFSVGTTACIRSIPFHTIITITDISGQSKTNRAFLQHVVFLHMKISRYGAEMLTDTETYDKIHTESRIIARIAVLRFSIFIFSTGRTRKEGYENEGRIRTGVV